MCSVPTADSVGSLLSAPPEIKFLAGKTRGSLKYLDPARTMDSMLKQGDAAPDIADPYASYRKPSARDKYLKSAQTKPSASILSSNDEEFKLG